jgi:hypothetical protein
MVCQNRIGFGEMTKYKEAREKIEHRLKERQWNSFSDFRDIFVDRRVNPHKQSISDATLRRVITDLCKKGLIESKWKCRYPNFYLVFSWKGEV